MRCQLTAEKLCVAAGHKDFQISTQQSVHEKIPAIHILDFIKEEIRYIRAIQLVYTGKHCVQIFRLDIRKAVIVKIDIGISHATLLKDLVAQGGFAATPDTDDNLCEITVPLEIRLFLSGHQFAGLIVPDLIPLLCQDLQYYLFTYHNLSEYHCKDSVIPIFKQIYRR